MDDWVEYRRLAGGHPSRVGRRRTGARVAPAHPRHLRGRPGGARDGEDRSHVARCHRRHAGTWPRRIPARRRLVREVARALAESSARARAPSCRAHRVALPSARRFAAAARRPRRVGRAHQPLCRQRAGLVRARRPDPRRCGGGGVRQGREAAGAGISGRTDCRRARARGKRRGGRAAVHADDARRSKRPDREGRPGFQLQRLEDGSACATCASAPGTARR